MNTTARPAHVDNAHRGTRQHGQTLPAPTTRRRGAGVLTTATDSASAGPHADPSPESFREPPSARSPLRRLPGHTTRPTGATGVTGARGRGRRKKPPGCGRPREVPSHAVPQTPAGSERPLTRRAGTRLADSRPATSHHTKRAITLAKQNGPCRQTTTQTTDPINFFGMAFTGTGVMPVTYAPMAAGIMRAVDSSQPTSGLSSTPNHMRRSIFACRQSGVDANVLTKKRNNVRGEKDGARPSENFLRKQDAALAN